MSSSLPVLDLSSIFSSRSLKRLTKGLTKGVADGGGEKPRGGDSDSSLRDGRVFFAGVTPSCLPVLFLGEG